MSKKQRNETPQRLTEMLNIVNRFSILAKQKFKTELKYDTVSIKKKASESRLYDHDNCACAATMKLL